MILYIESKILYYLKKLDLKKYSLKMIFRVWINKTDKKTYWNLNL